jgi:hypothetical protein
MMDSFNTQTLPTEKVDFLNIDADSYSNPTFIIIFHLSHTNNRINVFTSDIDHAKSRYSLTSLEIHPQCEDVKQTVLAWHYWFCEHPCDLIVGYGMDCLDIPVLVLQLHSLALGAPWDTVDLYRIFFRHPAMKDKPCTIGDVAKYFLGIELDYSDGKVLMEVLSKLYHYIIVNHITITQNKEWPFIVSAIKYIDKKYM